MPYISLEYPHTIGQEEATRRLKEKFDAANAEHGGRVDGLHHEWQDNKFLFAFKALGMAIGGSVAVEPEMVVVEAKVPLAAMLMKRPIEDRLRREINEILTP